jgi:hypothetical protein
MAKARLHIWLFLLALSAGAGCTQRHHAPVASSVPPPVRPEVLHTGRLWLSFEGHTPDTQCVRPGEARALCFEHVREALARALERGLWPSFPEVSVKEHGDELAPGDYLLWVQLGLEAQAPQDAGPGWSAVVRGRWRLIRDGFPVAGETVFSRSRADFPYGHSLGVGAGEVLDAVSVRIASVLGGLPEKQSQLAVPLPPVETSEFPTGGGPQMVARP